MSPISPAVEDFTIGVYASLLERARERYQFIGYGAEYPSEGSALWRHDIDFSPNRALAVAALEAKLGLRASYFVQITSPYYNAFEPAVADKIRGIAKLGHWVGLHFEPFGEDALTRLKQETDALSSLLGISVNTFSLHNPTTYEVGRFSEPQVAGLINASTRQLGERFTYCSDSNGVWRHRSLHDVLADPESRNVHILTHPEWWQESVMLPREKIRRCIEGRAVHCNTLYDELLAAHGRPNVGAKEK